MVRGDYGVQLLMGAMEGNYMPGGRSIVLQTNGDRWYEYVNTQVPNKHGGDNTMCEAGRVSTWHMGPP